MGNSNQSKFLNKGNYKINNGFYILSFSNTQQQLLAVKKKHIIIFWVFSINRQFKIVSILDADLGRITCLEQMEKSNNFITGCDNSAIQIWELNKNFQYSIVQILEGHYYSITCVIVNKNEDLIISGSGDETIKFWNKKRNWECLQTVETKSGSIQYISLNEEGNQLVCIGLHEIITILNQKLQGQWQILQTIKVEIGYYCIFLNKDQFMYIPAQNNNIEIYGFDIIVKQYKKMKNIKVPQTTECCNGFKPKVLQNRKLTFIKKGQFVSFIRINQNNTFELIQSLECSSYLIYGHIQDNGTVFALTDVRAKQIQFFKLNSVQ